MKSLISLLQKQKVTNAIRLQKLKAGQSPSNKEVVESVVKAERGHLSGEPYYKAMNVLPHTITNYRMETYFWESEEGS